MCVCTCFPGLPSDILSSVRPELLSGSADNTSDTDAVKAEDCSSDYDIDRQLLVDEGVLVADEEQRSGVVRLSVYWSYWLAVGRCLASLVLLSILLMQGSMLFDNHFPYTQQYCTVLYYQYDDDDTYLTAIFQDICGKPVPECLHSGFYWS